MADPLTIGLPSAPSIEEEEEVPYESREEKVRERGRIKAPKIAKRAVRQAIRGEERAEKVRERFSYKETLDQYEAIGTPPKEIARNVFNFMLGDDLAVTGLEWNENNFSWSMDNLKHTWSDDPLWRNGLRILSFGANFIPVYGLASKSMKFGKLGKATAGTKLAEGVPGIRPFKYVADEVTGTYSKAQGTSVKQFNWFDEFRGPRADIEEFEWLKGQGHIGNDMLDVAGNAISPTWYDAAGGLTKAAKANVKAARQTVETLQRGERISRMNRAMELGEESYAWGGQIEKIRRIDKAKLAFHEKFANSYWQMSNSQDVKLHQMFAESVDQHYRVENFGKMFEDIPDSLTASLPLQKGANKYMLSGDTAHLAGMDKDSVAYMMNLRTSYMNHQDEFYDIGLGIGTKPDHLQTHVPAQRPGTAAPDVEPGLISVIDEPKAVPSTAKGKPPTKISVVKMPALGGKTFKQRGTRTVDELLNKIDNGEIISDLKSHSLPNHMLDRLYVHNFKWMRDVVNSQAPELQGVAMAADTMKTAGNVAKRAYLDLEKLPFDGKEALRRVLRKSGSNKLGSNGELPWVSRSFFEDWMGKNGMMEQAEHAASFIEGLTTLFKTAKTAGNPATHMTNLYGNIAMLHMAGYNAVKPANLKTGSQFAHGFHKYAKELRKVRTKAEAAGKEFNPQRIKDGVDDVIDVVNANGDTISLRFRDFLNDKEFMALVEESAFEKVEGLARLEHIHGKLKGAGKRVLDVPMAVKNAPGLRWVLDNTSEAYLLEDMVPKAMLYAHYVANGLPKHVAAGQVGRALPMYNSVGQTVAGARKWAFPWITFPAEMTRIMKNQMMDNPMRVLPWLMATDIIQSTGYMSGVAGRSLGVPGLGVESFEDLEQARLNLPTHAQTPMTAIGGETATDIAGGAAMGIPGMIAGARFGGRGGARGAAIGAGLGIGAALIKNTYFDAANKRQDSMRAASLRWIPHTSLMFGTDAPDLMNPMTGKDWIKATKRGDVAQMASAAMPGRGLQQTYGMLPVQPLAIFEPMLNMMTGKNAMGQEIKAEDEGAFLRKTVAGMIGVFAPPMIQKYGYKQTSPTEDVPVIGRTGTALLGAAGGAAIGAARGGLPGAVTGGVLGGVAGGVVNTNKLMQDLGISENVRTKRAGEPFADFILNNLTMMKTYRADPSYRAGNTKMNVQYYQDQRTAYKKEAIFRIGQGDDEGATELLVRAQETFEREYPMDPDLANEKFQEWATRLAEEAGPSPVWRGYSEEEVSREMRRNRRLSGRIRSQSLQDWQNALMAHRRMK